MLANADKQKRLKPRSGAKTLSTPLAEVYGSCNNPVLGTALEGSDFSELSSFLFPLKPSIVLHNKKALMILETKRSQLILDNQAINTSYISQCEIKKTFLTITSNMSKQTPESERGIYPTSLRSSLKLIKEATSFVRNKVALF